MFVGALIFRPKEPMGMRDRTDQAMIAPVLDVCVFSVIFRGLHALDCVSCADDAHRMTTGTGPNGAGKSTLFHMIFDSPQPRAGQELIEKAVYAERFVCGLPGSRALFR